MQPPHDPGRLTFDGIVSLLDYIHGKHVEVASVHAGRVAAATINGHPADARWIAGMRRLVEDGEAIVEGDKITLTPAGVASLRRAWPTAPALRTEPESS
jgi:hypothetical protein